MKMVKAGRANNTGKKTLNAFFSILFLLNTLIKFVYLCVFFILFIFRHTSNQIIIYFFMYLNEHS